MLFTRIRSSLMLAVVLALMAATLITPPIQAGAPAQAGPTANPYAGVWHGPFTTDVAAFGYVVFDIASNGQVSGAATYYPGGIRGNLVGHVNDDGFGAFIFHSPPQVIPYLLFVSINADGQLEVIAPTPWSDGFSVFATLNRD